VELQHRSRVTAAAALLVLLLGGPAGAQQPSDISAQWAGYWNAKNLKAVLTLYGDDPLFCPTNGHSWSGIAQIRRNFAGLLAVYDPRIVLSSVRSEAGGDLAYDSGTYEEVIAPVKGGKAIRAAGTYLFVFKRDKHKHWQIVEQTWTSFEPVKL
jgi:ketosteroid isomerase-like protein